MVTAERVYAFTERPIFICMSFRIPMFHFVNVSYLYRLYLYNIDVVI